MCRKRTFPSSYPIDQGRGNSKARWEKVQRWNRTMREAMWALSPAWLLVVYSWWMAVPSLALAILPSKLKLAALLAVSAFQAALAYYVVNNSGLLCGPKVLSIHCEATLYVPVGWV